MAHFSTENTSRSPQAHTVIASAESRGRARGRERSRASEECEQKLALASFFFFSFFPSRSLAHAALADVPLRFVCVPSCASARASVFSREAGNGAHRGRVRHPSFRLCVEPSTEALLPRAAGALSLVSSPSESSAGASYGSPETDRRELGSRAEEERRVEDEAGRKRIVSRELGLLPSRGNAQWPARIVLLVVLLLLCPNCWCMVVDLLSSCYREFLEFGSFFLFLFGARGDGLPVERGAEDLVRCEPVDVRRVLEDRPPKSQVSSSL